MEAEIDFNNTEVEDQVLCGMPVNLFIEYMHQ